LGVGSKNEVEASRSFFSIALRQVLDMRASLILVPGFTEANRFRRA
jgi:hypothetical protein